MWSDKHSETDFLNYASIAESACEQITNLNMLPLSIGIYGSWGVGKSSMMSLLKSTLSEATVDTQSTGDETDTPTIVCIDFNAWLYQGYDDAKNALLDVVLRKLEKEAKERATALEKVGSLFKRLDYLKIAGYTVKIAAYAGLGFGLPGALGTATNAVVDLLTKKEREKDSLNKIEKGFLEVAKDASSIFKEISKDTSPSKEIDEFRDNLEAVLKELNLVFVVCIDDLDRCLPKIAIETLEAIRLLLFVPRTAFVIAADEHMIRYAVQEHFKDIPGEYAPYYLDKLIQIPVRVPPLGTQEVRAYMMQLFLQASKIDSEEFEKLRTEISSGLSCSWRGGKIDVDFLKDNLPDDPDLLERLRLAERLAPIMTNSSQIKANPRLIKRFMNTITMRGNLAKKQDFDVDEAVLAKLALFQRCAGDKMFMILIKDIIESPTGKSELIRKGEAAKTEGKPIPDLFNNADSEFKVFLEEWLSLKPNMADVDLRQAVYVSRDTIQLRSEREELSFEAQTLLEALLELERPTDENLSSMFGTLSLSERSIVTSRLVEELQKVSDFSVRPKTINGLVLIASKDQISANLVKTTLKEIEQKKKSIGPWIVPMIRNADWASDLLLEWKETGNARLKRGIEQTKGI